MTKKISYLAIIPARGGSKRLANKNMLLLKKKPLIAYSIEAALKSEKITDILVTSDDIKILSFSKKFDILTLNRPKSLASDTSSTFSTVKHAIENTIKQYDYVVLLQPTSPLRNEQHINEAIQMLESKNADAIVSVCEMDHSPLWANTLDPNLSMENFLSEKILEKRSQDLEKYYRLNGAIYICKTTKLLENQNFLLKKNIYAYIMKKEDSIDIDEELDFTLAKILLTKRET